MTCLLGTFLQIYIALIALKCKINTMCMVVHASMHLLLYHDEYMPGSCLQVDLSLPRGVGEKRLLRESAAILGLSSAAALPKRAIQFGSRIAKLAGTTGGKELGRNPCKRLVPLSADSSVDTR